jgi:hypothetical protein
MNFHAQLGCIKVSPYNDPLTRRNKPRTSHYKYLRNCKSTRTRIAPLLLLGIAELQLLTQLYDSAGVISILRRT